MTIECYMSKCKHHSCNSGDPHDEGPFCYEQSCILEDEIYEAASLEAAELDSPNSPDYDRLVESIQERMWLEHQPDQPTE